MKSAEPGRMTRVQVQEKLKRNFQALCSRCPQLANNYDVLDDSLTSLHWLSNLNVNIGGPSKEAGNNSAPRNHNLLPSFPSPLLKNGQSSPTLGGQNTFVPGEVTYAKRNWNVQAPKGSPSSTTKVRNGGSRKTSAKNPRNASAPTLGRANPLLVPADNNQRILHSASVSSSKMVVRGLPINSALSQPQNGSNHSDALTFAVPGWGHDIIDVKPPNVKKNITNSSHLPQIQLVSRKHQNPNFEEPPIPAASPNSQYSFSPREVMLDLLPSQVDYKNNPHVKPTFSFTSLICMALQNNKKHKMSFSSICKWITDNFMYYRYADPGWQNSVKLNLTQSKYFTKVPKKDSSAKSYLWEINPVCNIKLRDSNSPLLINNLRRNDPRLEPVQISPASSLSLPTVPHLPKFEKDEGTTFLNRKRKQTTPQKSVRRRTIGAKKRRNNIRSAGNRNLLQEEAPELGSLKGDFNWNTIFDEVFGATEAALSVTPTSLASRPSTNEGNESREITSRLTDDVTNGTLLALDMLSLPDIPEPEINDENHDTPSALLDANKETSWQIKSESRNIYPEEKMHVTTKPFPLPISKQIELPTLEDCDLFFPESNEPEMDSLNIDDIDLTITGKQIAPPEEWIPVSPDLEAILCETQNDEVLLQHPSDTLDVDRLLMFNPSPQNNNPDQYLSSVEIIKKRKQKSRKTDPVQDNNNSIIDQNSPFKNQQTTWQQNHLTSFN